MPPCCCCPPPGRKRVRGPLREPPLPVFLIRTPSIKTTRRPSAAASYQATPPTGCSCTSGTATTRPAAGCPAAGRRRTVPACACTSASVPRVTSVPSVNRQSPSTRSKTSHKSQIRNLSGATRLGRWCLRFGICLSLGACHLVLPLSLSSSFPKVQARNLRAMHTFGPGAERSLCALGTWGQPTRSMATAPCTGLGAHTAHRAQSMRHRWFRPLDPPRPRDDLVTRRAHSLPAGTLADPQFMWPARHLIRIPTPAAGTRICPTQRTSSATTRRGATQPQLRPHSHTSSIPTSRGRAMPQASPAQNGQPAILQAGCGDHPPIAAPDPRSQFLAAGGRCLRHRSAEWPTSHSASRLRQQSGDASGIARQNGQRAILQADCASNRAMPPASLGRMANQPFCKPIAPAIGPLPRATRRSSPGDLGAVAPVLHAGPCRAALNVAGLCQRPRPASQATLSIAAVSRQHLPHIATAVPRVPKPAQNVRVRALRAVVAMC